MLCPRCRAENSAGRRFCAACGASLAPTCSVCGFANDVDAKFCGGCGRALTPPPGSKGGSAYPQPPAHLAAKILRSRDALEGERKQVTVLLTDLRGSLELLSGRDPEDARALLDPVLERMIDAVHRFEGTVNQVMGDGIMALFGAPVAHEDHAVRAGYAALRMQASVSALAEQIHKKYGATPQIRVGLNAGEVVVRGIGNDLTMDYTAVGETTHLAGRMEQLARPGTILVTETFVRLTEGYLHFKPLGLVAIRGLAEPIEVFELVDAEPTRGRFQAAARGRTRFVGRQSEFEALERALRHARSSHGQVVALIGEPGVGKSRLFYEFIDSPATNGCTILETAAVSFGKLNAYFPLRELLKTFFQIEDSDATDTVRQKVAAKLTDLDSSLSAVLPALLALLDVSLEDPTWHELDPGQRRQQMLDAVKRLLIRLSQTQPLIVMVENLHWIDVETQAFLDNLIESLPTARFLLLVNYRPEYQHSWGSKTSYIQLRLDPLPAESAEELLRVMLGDTPELEPLKKLLVQRTEGNPFFLEECIHTLVETKGLVGERGAFRLGKPLSVIQVPVTVQAILAARIDRLSAEDKRVLQCAATIGKDVSFPLLQAVAATPEGELRQSLAQLQTAEFLYEGNLFPELEYTFKHGLTQEVAYASLLLERRRELHSRIVHALESLQTDRPQNDYARLAHHAFRGALWEKAVAYFRQAGTKAMSSTYREAIFYFDQALEALRHLPENRDSMEQAIDIRLDLRRALAPLADRARILDHMQKAEALASTLGDRRRLSWIAYAMSYYHYLSHDQERSLEAGQRALALSEGADVEHEIGVNMLLGYSLHVAGDYSKAIGVLRRNIDTLIGERTRERFGLPVFPAVTCRERLVRCLAEKGEFAEGIRLGEEGLRMAEELQHPLSLVQMCVGLGHLYLLRDDNKRALPVLERGLALGRQWDISLYVSRLASRVGRAYVRTGRAAEGLALLKQGAEDQAVLGIAGQLARLAEGYLVVGEPDAAWEQAEQALSLARRYKERGQEAWILHLCGEIAARRDPVHGENAGRLYREGIELAQGLGMRPALAHGHVGLGEVHSRAGRLGPAREHLAAASALFRDMGITAAHERAERGLRDLPG